jgi:hypothetical protein
MRWRSRRAEGRLSRRRVLAALAALGAAAATRANAETPRIGFGDLYKSFGVLGLEFSDRLVGLRGAEVAMRGFMAPPLRAESDFFVLTREPLALCPFCSSDADWPVDIVVVYLHRQETPTNPSDRIEVTGTLEVGSWVDPESGFVSMIRIVDARFRRA